MAYLCNLGAAAAVVANRGFVVRRRRPNIPRKGCESLEDAALSCRLSEENIQQLSDEFVRWQQTRGIATGQWYAERRVRLFLLYLARGGFYHQVGRAEGLSLAATATYLHQVAEFFADSASQCVLFKVIRHSSTEHYAFLIVS
jgi:hypothetical protein